MTQDTPNSELASLRVVYVEDDARLARLTSQYLTSHGVEVVLVARGDLAIAEIERVHPDVVLLELMLPGFGRRRGVPAVRRGPRRRAPASDRWSSMRRR